MKSIRTKILICMSTTVLVGLTLLGGISIFLNMNSSREMLEQLMNETATVASERITQELTAYMNVAINAGFSAELADPTKSDSQKQAIVDQRAAAHGFQRGNIIGANGISTLDGKDYSDRDYYQSAMKGNTQVSEPLVSKVTGALTIIIAAPLWEGGVPGSKVIGAVYFVPPETFLNDIVSGINISENSSAYAINANGTTIADKTLDTIMTQNIEELSKTDPTLAGLSVFHGKMRNGESGFGEYSMAGDNRFIAYAPIAGTTGWSMGITAPESDFMQATVFAVYLTIGMVIAFLIISALIAFKLANGIGVPIKLCAQRLQRLCEGDISSSVPKIKSSDEVGILSTATTTLVETMYGIISDMGTGLGELANGNFDIKSGVDHLYIGDFKPLSTSMYSLIKSFSEMIVNIRQSADQVTSGAEQVSAGAQALSQGATEQAASVEELAATIINISEQVKSNAESAASANSIVEAVGGKIITSNERMQDLVAAISEISKSSAEIQKIVKTIEDIAFQTNILALNAAVEAARAGESGKGFAVVADEVRNLAMKSATASKDTTLLIEGSLKSVSNGTRIADETAKSLIAVVSEAREATSMVEQITQASNEQSNSIAQVTQGIDQISAVVQTNSATAEQSAAASEELSGQAQALDELVRKFKLSSEM